MEKFQNRPRRAWPDVDGQARKRVEVPNGNLGLAAVRPREIAIRGQTRTTDEREKRRSVRVSASHGRSHTSLTRTVSLADWCRSGPGGH